MSGWTTSNGEHLIRAQLWSNQIKEAFEDELMGTKYVKFIENFPDGDLINIPSIGQAPVYDYEEGQAVRYAAMDTGNFQFSIDTYVHSGTYITEKMKQDSYLMSQLVSSFVPKQRRAIMKRMEADILKTGPNGQTTGNLNLINGGAHRWIGSGSSEALSISDFIKARYSLSMAQVPMVNLVAIVDPTCEFALASDTNLNSFVNNPMWRGIVESGLTTGMKFIRNIHGFDVYVSHNLKKNTGSETINGKTAATGVNNLFFAAAGDDAMPIVGQIRQQPKVDSEFNKDLQREEYVTTARWGFKLYRPENMICVVTDTDSVPSF
jgi:hypothetical protein